MIPNLQREQRQPLDLDQIRQDFPLPSVVASSGVKLIRAGNEFKACCPFHSERTPSFTIYSGGHRFQCFGCGAQGDVFDFLGRLHGVSLREAAELLVGGDLPSVEYAPVALNDAGDRLDEARAIWRNSAAPQGTPVEAYLASRGLRSQIPETIRYARLRYGTKGIEHPVLVAAVSSVDGRLSGIQRTYLAADGMGKLEVAKPKLSLGRVSGGAIRLAPVSASLVVCEGLEDGLTLQQELGRAVWVAAGASMLPNMLFPPGVQSVAIGGDADDAGRAAARKAAETFTFRGIESRVFFPVDAKDFNDELTQGARA